MRGAHDQLNRTRWAISQKLYKMNNMDVDRNVEVVRDYLSFTKSEMLSTVVTFQPAYNVRILDTLPTRPR